MRSFAIIPAAPILLAGVDLAETATAVALRTSIESALLTKASWALPISGLPPLAGLGGLGIDRGIDTRTNELLEGEDWVQAVSELSPANRADCESAHPAIAVALLHAHASGVRIGPLGSSDDLLVPIDLSAAASYNAPLAPVPLAAEADDRIVRSLQDGDIGAVSAAIAAAADVHADLDLLDAAVVHMRAHGGRNYSFTTVFDERVHEVRSLCGTGTY
ncbi:hypothetical protein [Brevibacterium sp. UCMA 11754]|uniref:hypothetical protein n=1 Tax=Brevibacterium sp. UCMA 11754 TaxID=2749198 RepID=UPI001F2251A0|nr:hypothetical protein [Brevibacterium sp. UCMA 11754]MCF2572931.1 hypothetical protein [Brevibacterium sp. UCMA 11754]